MSSIVQEINKQMQAEIISDIQRIEIVKNFIKAIYCWDTIPEMEFHIIDSVKDGNDLENFLPKEIYERDDLEELKLDDMILEILQPILSIWNENLTEVFAKYKNLKVAEYIDKFTFDTKENIKKLYDEICEDVGANPEDENEEDMDDEESASYNIYGAFIVEQVKYDFSIKINDYILELKTSEVLDIDQDKKNAELEAELEAQLASLKKEYNKVKKQLKKLREKKLLK